MDSLVVDSLRYVIAHKDSVIALAATRSTGAPGRDLLDWLGLAASLLVAPLIALIATWYGGWLAEKGRTRETKSETERRREQMKERIRRTLRRAIALAEGVTEIPSFQELGRRGAEMRILWESFERQSGDLYLVGDAELRAKIEEFVGSLHSSVAGTEAALSDLGQRRATAMIGAQMSGSAPSNIESAHSPRAILDQFRADLVNIKGKAEGLLKLVDLDR